MDLIYLDYNYFLSCDSRLVSQAKKFGLEMTILNPVDYIRMEDQ
jgi:hypothetical protein